MSQMYQYPNQSSLKDMKTSCAIASSDDMFLLFDKFPGNPPSSTATDKVKQEPMSAPASADVSPYMSEKECTEQAETEDPESPGNFNSKRRMSLNKAERRAEHNAIERARRECLNSKFQQLAEALPNLQNHRRPSKGQIVEKALDWVKQNMSKEDRYQYQIMQLQNENKRLMTQINIAQEQSSSGIITPPINSTSPATAPFPVGLRQQQFPANSTPTATEVPPSSTGDNKVNSMRVHPHYINQVEETHMMYSMAPLSVEWQQQPVFVGQKSVEYMMPSASSSSSSRLLHEDDNESSSSNEEVQNHHIQMSYNDMSQCALFEMDHSLPGIIAPWGKIQQHPQYPSYPLSSSMANPVYTHNNTYSS